MAKNTNQTNADKEAATVNDKVLALHDGNKVLRLNTDVRLATEAAFRQQIIDILADIVGVDLPEDAKAK